MTHFSGKLPPPWQTRPQNAISGSLMGQHPNTVLSNQQIVLGSQQTSQFGPSVQQSIIQSPGLSLQTIPQHLISQQNSLVQTTIGAAVPPSAPQSNHANPNLIIQSPINTQPAVRTPLVPHAQLSSTQIQPLPSQIASVSYPPPRPLAPPGALGNTSGTLGHSLQASELNDGSPSTNSNIANAGMQPLPKQRVFTGKITKLCADFGFVNEDVFFQTSCIKGQTPKVGDRVLVEASYNQNMPFKWNATRIQVIPNTSTSTSGNSFKESESRITFGTLPACNFSTESGVHGSSTKARTHKHDFKDNDRTNRESKGKETKRDHLKRSGDRFYSPPRRRARTTPRYNVQVPTHTLYMKEAGALELRKRYPNLYVPSDMFLSRPLWCDTFPAHRCFQFPRAVPFHIMHKEVDSIGDNDAIYDPPDANHAYSAKVLLLSVPSMEDIYRRCCAANEDDSDDKAGFVHPARLINFLVGLKGKNETMAIGGYWSPSLDGPNPQSDSSVLVRTCIRTCKALTGIDLSGCSMWYRFAEIYYLRGESTHKGRVIPAHVETTVLFIPDVWNICPTKLEWSEMQSNYKQLLNNRLCAKQDKDEPQQPQPQDAPPTEPPLELDEQPEEEGEDKADVSRKEPQHWSTLDPKNMKVTELKNELDARFLNSKGLKSQLVARLTKALKSEQEKEEQEKLETEELKNANLKINGGKSEETKKVKIEDEKKNIDEIAKIEEKERLILEKRYTLPDQPSLVVHPSRVAKSGKFDCSTLSLSVLLDYRQEDNKEHSFEVSLFAELFNEMLMRDFAFKIYQAIVEAPEKSDRKDKDRKSEKDERGDKNDIRDEIWYEKKNSKGDHTKSTDDISESILEEQEEKDSADDSFLDDDNKSEKDKDSSVGQKTKMKNKKDKRNPVNDPFLLLSCVYFDQTHTGYILDKDLENIINLLALNLSRAQIKKLLSKVLTRDAFYYLKLTDSSLDDKRTKDGLIDLEMLAKGNNQKLPLFAKVKNPPESLRLDDVQEKSNDKEGSIPGSGMVMYDGSLIDISKLLQNLERSERDRTEAEEKCKNFQKELAKTKEDAKKTAEKSSRLNKEAKSALSTLKTTQDNLQKALENADTYKQALKGIKEIVHPLIGRENQNLKEEPKEENFTLSDALEFSI